MTSTFGDCARCHAAAIVKLNGEPLCQADYEAAMTDIGAMLERALEHDRNGT